MDGVRLKNPSNPKERNLLKGAIRRVFSRSDLRKQIIAKSIVKGYQDPNRKAVKFWVKCETCGNMEAKSNVQVDHVKPVISVTETLEDLTWDELVNRLWCEEQNLAIICIPCHKVKSKQENKERREFKKAKKLGGVK